MKNAHTVFGASLLSLLVTGCVDPQLDPIPLPPSYLGLDLGNIAVVTGDYDRIEEVLAALEISFQLYDGFVVGPSSNATLAALYNQPMPSVEILLESPELLAEFDVLFVNCGVRGTGITDPATLETQTHLLDNTEYLYNLRTFVENGGNLFVSDRSYTLLEAVYPSLIEFQGDDLVPNAALLGAHATLAANVTNQDLAQAVNSSSVEVDFPVSHWAMVSSSEGVWLTADALRLDTDSDLTLSPATPILLHQQVGYGSITFASFHNLPEVNQAMTDVQLFILRTMGSRS